MGLLALYATLRDMTLKIAYDEEWQEQGDTILFTREQTVIMGIMQGMVHAKELGAKSRNPFRRGTMAWEAWTIARLGGWRGLEKAHGRPGYFTMGKGMEIFYRYEEPYEHIKKERKDVYKDEIA